MAVAPVHNDAVQAKEDDGADDCSEPRGDVEELIERVRVEESSGKEAAQERTDDPDDRCHEVPPGSFPGMIAFAIRPASRPRMMNAMMPMTVLSVDDDPVSSLPESK